jgi:hypothetical protein
MSLPPWLPLTLAATAAACAPHAALRPPASSAAILTTQTQELLDAVTRGDRSVWERYLDPDVVYVSEAGETENKQALLAELTPLPAGISGKLTVAEIAVRLFGDTAVVVHTDDEREVYFGHALDARYLSTATWRFGAAGWRLVAQQVYATLRDPRAIALPPAQLDEYAGSYRLTDTITYTIRREGDGLVGQRDGRPPQALRVEVRDVLFVPGQPRSRKVFFRDADGRVDRFADRREARDVLWVRRR